MARSPRPSSRPRGDIARLGPLADLGVRTARLDYADPSTVAPVLTSGDVLVLVSGREMGHRVEQHTGVIAAAHTAGIGRILYTSAPAATTSALVVNPEHKATEEYLAASGVSFTVLRNGWYSENYSQQVRAGRADGRIFGSVGDGRVASAARKDYADAAAAAALDESFTGRVLELSGDTAWTHEELAATLFAIVGAPVEYRDLTPAAHFEHLIAAGIPEARAGFAVALDANIRDGLLGVTTGDLSSIIGRPTTPLAETLADV